MADLLTDPVAVKESWRKMAANDTTIPEGPKAIDPNAQLKLAARDKAADPFAGLQEVKPNDPFAGLQPVDHFAGLQPADSLDLKDVKSLTDDDTFRPADYLSANPNLHQDAEKSKKLLDVYRAKRERGLEFKKVAKAAVTEAPGIIAKTAKGVRDLGARVIETAIQPAATSILSALTGATPEEKAAIMAEQGKEQLKAAGEVTAGTESAITGLAQLGQQGGRKVKHLFGKSVKDLSDSELLDQLYLDSEFSKATKEVAEGKGDVVKAAGLDADTLAKSGVTLNKEAIEHLSLVDPLTLVATAGAFKVVGLGGRVIATAATKVGAQTVINGLAKVAQNVGAKGIEAVGKTAASIGKTGQAIAERIPAKSIGFVLGATKGGSLQAGAIGAAAGEAAKRIGYETAGALTKQGARVAELGSQLTPGFVGPRSAGVARLLSLPSTTAGKIAKSVAGGAVQGAVTAIPLAAAADESETAGALLAGGVGLGATHGLIHGTGTAVAETVAKNYLDPHNIPFEKTNSPGYGVDKSLDASHDAAITKLPENEQNAVNTFREAVRAGGGEIYVQDAGSYLNRIRENLTQENGGKPLTPAQEAQAKLYADTHAFFDGQIPDGTGETRRVVFLNGDSTGLHHDAGHLFQSLLSPENQAALRESALSSYSPEQLAAFKDEYARRIGEPDYFSKLGEEAGNAKAADELIAENFSQLFQNKTFADLSAPRSFLKKLGDTAVKAGEALGFDLTAGRTTADLGAKPSFRLQDLLRNAAQDVLTRESAPVKEKPLTLRPEDVARREANVPVTKELTPELVKPAEPAPAPEAKPVDISPKEPVSPPAEKAPVSETPASTAKNIRVERTAQSDFASKRAEETGVSEAQKATESQPEVRKVVDDIAKSMEAGNPVLEVEHRGIVSERGPSAPEGRTSRRGTQEAGYQELERLQVENRAEAPADIVDLHQKTFVPVRFTTQGGKPTLIAMSLDKVIANVRRVVKDAVGNAAEKLLPYPVENGKLTDAGWKQAIADVQAYAENQSNGYRGDGQKLTRPTEDIGVSLPAENPNYTPKPLSEASMNFANLVQGLAPPETGRVQKGLTPGNVKGQLLAEINKKQPMTPAVIKPENVTKQSFKGFEPRTVKETNPLRNELAARGVKVRELTEVTERLAVADIASVKPRTDLAFKAPVTDTIRAGFLPKWRDLLGGLEKSISEVKKKFFPEPPDPIGDIFKYWRPPEGLAEKSVRSVEGTGFRDNLEFVKTATSGEQKNIEMRDKMGALGGSSDLQNLPPNQIHWSLYGDKNDWMKLAYLLDDPKISKSDLQKAMKKPGYPDYLDTFLRLLQVAKNKRRWNQGFFSGEGKSYEGTSVNQRPKLAPEEHAIPWVPPEDIRNATQGDSLREDILNDPDSAIVEITPPEVDLILDYLKENESFPPLNSLSPGEQKKLSYVADKITGESPKFLPGNETDKAVRAGLLPDTKPSEPTPSADIRSLATSYAKGAGVDYRPARVYSSVNPDVAKRIADFYDSAQSNPQDPAVQASYRALIDETAAQYKAITDAGYKIEPYTGKGEPYKNSAAAVADIRDNKHLYFLTPEEGFASASDNPMLAPVEGTPYRAIELFRAVHDFFGHGKEGYQFGPRGEFNAWRAHSEMYSPESQGALAAETLAQNFWTNYGQHVRDSNGTVALKGQPGYVELTSRPFPEQKNVVVPAELIDAARKAAGESPKFLPSDKPVAELGPDIAKMSPDEWRKFTESNGGHLTPEAYKLGLGLTDAKDLELLRRFQSEHDAKGSEALKSGDFDTAMTEATKGQFFREAAEAATDTGSAANPRVGWRKVAPDAKPPFAGGEAKFLPRTEAGKKAAEKGFDIAIEGNLGIREAVIRKGDKVVGKIVSSSPENISEASINFADVNPKLRGQGLGEAAYRELLTQLKEDGVKDVTGITVAGQPLAIREKIFGKGSTEITDPENLGDRGNIPVDQAIAELNDGGLGFNARNKITPESKFLPKEVKPKSDFTKELLKDHGWTLNFHPLGLGDFMFSLRDGKNLVADLSIHRDNGIKNYAEVGSVETSSDHRGKGAAEALYREAATKLQELGVTRLGGNFLTQAPMNLRQKLFGEFEFLGDDLKQFDETEARSRLPESPASSLEEAAGRRTGKVVGVSTINPAAKFLPKTDAGKELAKKGFDLQLDENSDKTQFVIRAVDKSGADVGRMEFHLNESGDGEIKGVEVNKEFREKGIGEALYREAGQKMKDLGVTEVSGEIIGPEAYHLRKKVFPRTRNIQGGAEHQADYLTVSDIGPRSKFLPKTDAGKELAKKGFDLQLDENSDKTQFVIRAVDKTGEDVGRLEFKIDDFGNSELSNVFVNPGSRRRGIGSTLYKEMGGYLQREEVSRNTGEIISPAAVQRRKSVFPTTTFRNSDGERLTVSEAIRDADEGLSIYAESYVPRTTKFLPKEKSKTTPKEDFNVIEPEGPEFLPKKRGVTEADVSKRDEQGRPLTKGGLVDYEKLYAEMSKKKKTDEAASDADLAKRVASGAYQMPKDAPKAGPATGWILPNQEFVPLDANYHEQFLANNSSELNKKFGTKLGETPDVNERFDALTKGFVRVRYTPADGAMRVELAASHWNPKTKKAILNQIEAQSDNIDRLYVALADKKGGVADSITENVADLSGPEKFTALSDAIGTLRGAKFLPSDEGVLPGMNLPSAEKVQQNRIKARVNKARDRFPEALPPEYAKNDAGKFITDFNGKPKPVLSEYRFADTPVAREAAKGIRGPEAREEAASTAIAEKLVTAAKAAQKNPDIAAGVTWYSTARTRLKKLLGDDTKLFSELLGATSARTPVETNFRFSLDAYNQFKRGAYDDILKKYREGKDRWVSGEIGDYVKATKDKEPTRAAFMDWWIQEHDLTPMQSNGKKFAMNSQAVLKVLDGSWATEVQGPKTPNFAGNLSGQTFEATIDVWASRLIHRLANEGNEKPWRILPENETGLSDSDFYLGQAIFRKAAEKLKMKPDALQAILWFAEKDHWEKNGWTRGAGAEKSDFNSLLKETERTPEGTLKQKTPQLDFSLSEEDIKPKMKFLPDDDASFGEYGHIDDVRLKARQLADKYNLPIHILAMSDVHPKFTAPDTERSYSLVTPGARSRIEGIEVEIVKPSPE